MAAVLYVLSHPLCFLVNKFGKTQHKLLGSALMDFYSFDDLSAAKIQLLKDSQKANSLNFPHVPQQRQGENIRATREIDDMFTLLTALDESENASLSALPVYVSNDPDNMPSVRLYEADFGVLMSLLDHFKSKLGVMESAISSVARDVYSKHRPT